MTFRTPRDRIRRSRHSVSETTRIIFLMLIGSLASSSSVGQELGQSRIQLVNGSTINGSVLSIDRDGNIVGQGIVDGINIQNVLSIKTDRKLEPGQELPIIVIPAGGGRWPARDLVIENDKLKFESPSGSRDFPLQSARAIIWTSSESIKNAILNPSKENDKIVVETANGERTVEGVIESIDSTSVHVNYQGDSKTIGIGKVKAVIMADLDLPVSQSLMATINLSDGSQWVGSISGLNNGSLSLNVVGDVTVTLSASDIIDITIASDRLVYLSDLDPIDVRERPVFSIKRSYRRDRSVENNSLSIQVPGGDEAVRFLKGLGTQAFSQLVFSKPDQFDRFKATVGIDAETNGRGDCKMAVWGDGIELWAKRIRASDGPQSVDLDISDMQEITLVVDPGERFDLGDHADWGNARFLKTK